MEKDNFSAEQNNISQSSETIEYPEFDPDKARKLRETEITKNTIVEEEANFLLDIEDKIASGELPSQLQNRIKEVYGTNIEILPLEQIKASDGHTAQHIIEYYQNQDGSGSFYRSHEIYFPEDILERDAGPQMIRHEFSHALEGTKDDASGEGLKRLFKDEKNYLGMCINEGMTEYMAELISGQKNIYEKGEDGKIPGYPNYYKFIKFLSSAGATKVDMKYFVDAYCLSGDEGDQAIATLRDKLAEAFPTENGVNPLDNLAAHNKDQIEYWIATYTKNID